MNSQIAGAYKVFECPICHGDHYAVDKSQDVCEIHDYWFVTVCTVCKRACFSETVGVCRSCLESEEYIGMHCGFNKDRRAVLRIYGYEEYE